MRSPLSVKGELVNFYASDGIRNAGFLMSGEDDRSCIIHVHGMTGNFYGSAIPFEMRSAVAQKGFSVFAINTRGHDRVAGMRRKAGNGEVGKIRMGTALERFEESIFDIEGAVSAMRARGFKRILLSGHSTGCQKITYYAYKWKSHGIGGLILLAPADDYNTNRAEMGPALWRKAVRKAAGMVSGGRGDEPFSEPYGFSARRFLSVADKKRVESRLFDYDGDLREFSQVRVPVVAVFGSEEEHRTRPVGEYLEMLERKSKSKAFVGVEIDGADHNFYGREDDVAIAIARWIDSSIK